MKTEGRPGLVYHVNDVSVDWGGGGPSQKFQVSSELDIDLHTPHLAPRICDDF